MFRALISLGLVVAALTGCASAPPAQRSEIGKSAPQVFVKSGQSIVDFEGDGVRLRGHLQIPAAQISQAKRPAIVFMHGCGGVGANGKPNARHQAALDWAVAQGYIALLPDSLGPRGERELCTQKFSQRKVQQSHRVSDAYAALAYLATRGDVDASRVALWGWSHGGSTVLTAMRSTSPAAMATRFAASIAFYPGCSAFERDAMRYTPRAPLHIFIGEADDWTPAAPCISFAQAQQKEGKPVTLTLYPGAYHDFDNPAPDFKKRVRTEVPNGVNPGKGVTVGPDPVARDDAMQKAAVFLQKHL